VNVEELEAKLEELTRERDAANAKHETLSALVEGYRRERDNLRAEISKAQESFDDDGASGWVPGETAIDALIRTRDDSRAEVERLRETIKLMWSSCGCCKCTVCTLSKDALHKKKGKLR
jgi:chromosome segregation ATPase